MGLRAKDLAPRAGNLSAWAGPADGAAAPTLIIINKETPTMKKLKRMRKEYQEHGGSYSGTWNQR